MARKDERESDNKSDFKGKEEGEMREVGIDRA